MSSTTAQTGPESYSKRQKTLTLLGTLLGMLLAALDQTIVATAGPNIQQSLHIEPSLYVWLTTSYLVASTVLVPIWGKLSDIYGRRLILIIGISIFLAGSLLCGFSQTTIQLIFARVVQGIGAASLFTTAFAVIADLFAPQERGRYAGLFGAVFGLSSVVGPLVGGFVTDNFGWHWCFFINLPVGAIALAVIISKMPPLRANDGRSQSIDGLGALVFAFAVVPLLLALSLGKLSLKPGDTGFLWGSPEILGMFALSLLSMVAFIFVERRAENPIIDLKLFRGRAFTIGNLAAFVTGMSFLGAIVFLPLFMVNVVGLSATASGLTTVPLTFGIVVGNIVSGQVSSKTGRYKFLILGSLVILIIGFAVMSLTLTSAATQASMTLRMILIGLGLGPSIPLFNLHISNAVEPRQIGVATSAATLFRQLGATMGLAVFGTVFGSTLGDAMTARLAVATQGVPPAFLAQMQGGATAGGDGEEAPAGRSFDKDKILGNVQASFAKQRELVTRALRDDDAAAMAELAQNPMLDERMKEAFAKGGVRKAVHEGFDGMRAGISGAFASPDPAAALAGIGNDARTPPALADKLKGIPAPALADPAARAHIQQGVLAGLDAAEKGASDEAVVGALAGATAGLAKAEAEATETIIKVDGAIKEAFTEAIARVYFVAIFLAMLALLVAMALPELPLRRGPPGAAPAAPALD